MKYTQANLDKLGDILGESDYVVRYERGTFQSGWCLLEQKKVVVLNKFLNVEGRINTLLELIPQINIDFDRLTHGSQKLYEEVLKRASVAQAEEADAQQEPLVESPKDETAGQQDLPAESAQNEATETEGEEKEPETE
ncbi:hypothetical protein QTN47_00215 [Danxiaibacter flavus]|uniref:Uncharacterized protein n=1 Tax=Danxiaibacter flavus TaxID=3049108 RepID=A0ABV3ZBT5_9BACT|nr:hypothetical protein QNM32_00215 [Chitinophagaceae bacterium DXS]